MRPEGAAKIEKFSAKICVRLCLEGGYRVLSEPVHYLSDVRPAARELWHSRPPIGLIELGIHNAFGLSAMRTRDSRGSCGAYCIAKYGVKWFRTQTVINSLAPRFHRGRGWRPWKVGRWRRQGRRDMRGRGGGARRWQWHARRRRGGSARPGLGRAGEGKENDRWGPIVRLKNGSLFTRPCWSGDSYLGEQNLEMGF